MLVIDLKEMLETIGPTASLVFAAWIFLSYLQSRYEAAAQRFRELLDEFREQADSSRHQGSGGKSLFTSGAAIACGGRRPSRLHGPDDYLAYAREHAVANVVLISELPACGPEEWSAFRGGFLQVCQLPLQPR